MCRVHVCICASKLWSVDSTYSHQHIVWAQIHHTKFPIDMLFPLLFIFCFSFFIVIAAFSLLLSTQKCFSCCYLYGCYEYFMIMFRFSLLVMFAFAFICLPFFLRERTKRYLNYWWQLLSSFSDTVILFIIHSTIIIIILMTITLIQYLMNLLFCIRK